MIHLLSGSDPTLLTDAVKATVDQLAEGIDRATDVHEFYDEEYTAADLAAAAAAQSMFSTHRVVIGRGLSRFAESELAPLIAYLAEPTPTTNLVLEWGSGRVPKSLDDAVKAAGGTKSSATLPHGNKNRSNWLTEKLNEVGVNLDKDAFQLVIAHLGEDLARLGSLLETLESIFGGQARLSAQDIEPYLGAAGRVPPWDLTDAVDSGNRTKALTVLQRMWQAEIAPMQVMASLNNHYNRILKLDGSGAQSNEQAAKHLSSDAGVASKSKVSPFSAGKALANARRLGNSGVKRSIELLARADSELRGVSGLDDRCVLEILVGRLAAISVAKRR